MPVERPTVIVLGGVNGAGKTTSSRRLLAEQLAVTTFVNADEIARGLCAFAPETVAMAAGRILLQRVKELAAERSGFAFETTLAGRTYVPFLKDLRGAGYAVEIHTSGSARRTWPWIGLPTVCGVAVITSRSRRSGSGTSGVCGTFGMRIGGRLTLGTSTTIVMRSRI